MQVRLGYDVIQAKYEVKLLDRDDGHQLVESDARHICLITSEIRVKITQPWLCSSERERIRCKPDDANPTRIWRNISEIRGKITQPRRWSSMGGSHRGKSDGAGLGGRIYWIISVIRVPDRDFLHQSVNAFEASPMIQVHLEYDVQGKLTQPWRWSSMGRRHRAESDGACPIIPLLNRELIPSNDYGKMIWGWNVLLPKCQGGETSTRGYTTRGQRRLRAKRVEGDTTRIVEGKIVTCFTHYKVGVYDQGRKVLWGETSSKGPKQLFRMATCVADLKVCVCLNG